MLPGSEVDEEEQAPEVRAPSDQESEIVSSNTSPELEVTPGCTCHYLLHVTIRVTCYVLHVTCYILHVTCHQYLCSICFLS